jgi:hypothetical protein
MAVSNLRFLNRIPRCDERNGRSSESAKTLFGICKYCSWGSCEPSPRRRFSASLEGAHKFKFCFLIFDRFCFQRSWIWYSHLTGDFLHGYFRLRNLDRTGMYVIHYSSAANRSQGLGFYFQLYHKSIL